MLEAFIAALAAIFKAIFGRGECPEAKAAAAAAQAKTELQTQETTNAQVATAIQAQRQSDARLDADPGQLRAPNPDSRD